MPPTFLNFPFGLCRDLSPAQRLRPTSHAATPLVKSRTSPDALDSACAFVQLRMPVPKAHVRQVEQASRCPSQDIPSYVFTEKSKIPNRTWEVKVLMRVVRCIQQSLGTIESRKDCLGLRRI